ncbi:hypothetical protein NO108_04886 [Planktothrix rubescens]|nr:hypothetical protein NO108_04886 [Planktothrix rubescens]
MFIKITWFNGLAIVASTSLLILNLSNGTYGQFDWKTATDTKNKIYESSEIIISNAKPARIKAFTEAEFKAVYSILTKGADRRDIESKLGKGKPDKNSNNVKYQSKNGRELKAKYGEDGGLQQWQWTDENKPKLEGEDDV